MLKFLIQRSRNLLVMAIMAGIVSGACSVLLLTQINGAISASSQQELQSFILPLTALAVLGFLARAMSQTLFEQLSQNAHANMRHFISNKILSTSFEKLEKIGGAKIQSALSDHSTNVAQFFVSVPVIITNAVVVIGCLTYMAYLSFTIFIVALCTFLFGGLGYHLAHLKAIKYLNNSAHEQDKLYGYFRSLIDGAKELKLNRKKRQHFKAQLLGGSIESVRKQRATGMSIFVISSSWGNFLIYAFIGLVLFFLAGESTDRLVTITGFSLVILYMVTPLEVLLINLPRANLAKVSAMRIDEITSEINQEVTSVESSHDKTSFKQIKLNRVTHSYYQEVKDDIFTLGPIDLEFNPGEVNILVGGNGSGKTSLAKLLSGLYRPESGEIYLDGKVVSEAEQDNYRQLFTAVFSDFHLFESLLECDETSSEEREAHGNSLIKKLHLNHKVNIQNGAFSTQSLSQGQRKRLALVITYLEERPFVIFDEWAADQDPVFKDIFYKELLPELKNRGKCVFVISHDDKYFDCADKLLYMESGQLIKVENNQKDKLIQSA